MEHRRTSPEQARLAAGSDQLQETRQASCGPRFEIDDGALSRNAHGARQALSALTLAMLVAVGGVGFFHKVLPQIIQAEKAKQAANGKKLAAKKLQPAVAPPLVAGVAAAPNAADLADAEEDLNVAQDPPEERLRKFKERRAEQWLRHQEFIERHRRRHEEAVDAFRGLPGGVDRLDPSTPDPQQKGPFFQPPPKIQFKELCG
jgi:hypothetical protein